MIFFCDKSEIYSTLCDVSKVTPSKTSLRAYEGILLEAKGDTCKMTGGNGKLRIETFFKADIKEEGIALVPARIFHELISKCYDGDIKITIDDKQMNIISGEMNVCVGVLDPDIYPSLKIHDMLWQFEMETAQFKELVNKTAFCALDDESVNMNMTRQVFTCIYISKTGDDILFKSTDSYIMAINHGTASGDDGKVLIPSKELDDIAKVLGEEGKVRIKVYDKFVIAEYEDIILTSNLLLSNDNEFGKFESLGENIIQGKADTRIKLKRSDLLNSISRAYVLSKVKGGNLIICNIDNEYLNINAKNEIGEISDKINVYQEGEPLRIGLNGKFLTSCLRNISDDYVIMEFLGNTRPCFIKPCEGNKYTFIILPVLS